MNKGLLEYVLVSSGGKLHESLLSTDIEPFHLQIALLMLGLKRSPRPLRWQGDPDTPQGDPVDIWVMVTKNGRSDKFPAEKWITVRNQAGKFSPMEHRGFIFTGSIVRDGVFVAQMDRSIVALFHDPTAMFDNPAPEGGNDEVWFVDKQKVMPKGTDVIVSIQKKK